MSITSEVESNGPEGVPAEGHEPRRVKCVVWDLDDTLWDGTLAEGDDVRLRHDVVAIIQELDRRGILHSVASRNSAAQALGKLEAFGLRDYFLHPQIGWNAKSLSIATIAKELNIGLDGVAFVDDQDFERAEVLHRCRQVLCLDPNDRHAFLDLPALMPRFITDDSRRRRRMYMSDICRREMEANYEGPAEDFLASLGMVFTIADAGADDLKRAEELTVRTHQLNTTGYTYAYEELDELRQSSRHKLLVAELEDRYGPYGKVGLALLETDEAVWTIKLLLMSCRVMGRGVGGLLVNHLRDEARKARVRLRAEFKHTKVNRQMYVTYRFAHFRELAKDGDLVLLENDLSQRQAVPPFVTLVIK